MPACPKRGRDFPTKYWGPAFWKTMHVSAVNYVKNDTNKRAWRHYLHTMLPLSLPCRKCRRHYMEKEKHFDYKTILASRESLMRFLVQLHNSVSADVARKTGRSFKPYKFSRHCRDLRQARRSRTRRSRSRARSRTSKRALKRKRR